ncbi:MAG: hypothetical protein WC722_05780 [Rhodospirillales bacterium]|jgi:hypothetical protein
MTAPHFSTDVSLLIDQARKGFEGGSDMAWLQAAHAAIGHRKDGGAIDDNPFDSEREKRLHESWEFYFNAGIDGHNRQAAHYRKSKRPFLGATAAAHSVVED